MIRFEDALRREVRGLSLGPFPDDLLARMAALDDLLVRWSARIGLVGFKTPEERMARYFLEPLAATPWLPSGSEDMEALDIGSGGGSPALPLALWAGRSRWRLLEPRRKRSLFLEEAVRELGLVDVHVDSERFSASPAALYDLITARGVRFSQTELEGIFESLKVGGRLLWFGGEDRLRECRDDIGAPDASDIEARGPFRLLGDRSRASLLVVEKRSAGRCFT